MIRVMDELRRWAATLPYWEQAALDRIVSGKRLSEVDYQEMLQYLLEDAGLASPKGERPALRFPQAAILEPEAPTPRQLTKISNLQNVNALVSGQALTFSPSLTAIYGGNGSGKSGYARVLGCAGFTRGDQEILPDVTRPTDETQVLSADIEITDGISNQVIHYECGQPCRELSSFYVFDSTSVQVHLTAANTLSFSPAGLSYLTRLAEVTDEVRKLLKARIETCTQPHFFDGLFQGESQVSTWIADLGPNTDIQQLRLAASLLPEERKHADELGLKIAGLRVQGISTRLDEVDQRIEDLENLRELLRRAEQMLSTGAIREYCEAIRNYHRRKSAVRRVSVDQFKAEGFQRTGEQVWYDFVRAAKALADAESTSRSRYPQASDRCLLCQQQLSTDARDLLGRLWDFLEGEAQRQVERAHDTVMHKRFLMDGLLLELNPDSVACRYLQEQDPSLLSKTEQFLAACQQRRRVLDRIDPDRPLEPQLPPMPSTSVLELEGIIKALARRRDELAGQDPTQLIAQMELERRNLQHRTILAENLLEIERYVERRRWADKARKAGSSTAHITAKYNQLFRQLVTDRYIELFEQTLTDLRRPLEVEVKTGGRKADAYKQIVVKTDPSAPKQMTAPDRVLSEGEKRAVALADFLTEVALDTASCGIVLDDPVTSLDLEWRALIASILAAEASHRQVIVFTHDLPFLSQLKEQCEAQGVEMAAHWIKRGDTDGRPGYVFLDNSPVLEKDYKDASRARDFHRRAKDAPPTEQETLLGAGFGALRTNYEAFIIFGLFNEVVVRWGERISFGRLREVVWDGSMVDEVIAACERLSRYIEGHLHSDAWTGEKPTPQTLLEEIEAFESIRRRLKDLRRQRV